MAILGREIRFAINPFVEVETKGANSFCARPSGEGLAIYFSMWVELTGKINSETGFVLNLAHIDKIVREYAVEIFDDFIKTNFKNQQHVSLEDLAKLLRKVAARLENKFAPAMPCKIELNLTPCRKLGIKMENKNMLYFAEKFEFAASHTLWNEKFSPEKNDRVFGKCANRTGHGHNYVVEVVVKKKTEQRALEIGRFQKIVDDEFIKMVDHKNLNSDLDYFRKINPTVENIATLACQKLREKLLPLELVNVTVWENERAYCTCTPK